MRVSNIQREYTNFLTAVIESGLEVQYGGIKSSSRSVEVSQEQSISFFAEPIALKHVKSSYRHSKLQVMIYFQISFIKDKINNHFEEIDSAVTKIVIKGIKNDNSGGGYFGLHFDVHNHNKENEKETKKKLNEKQSGKKEDPPHQLHPKFHTQFLVNPEEDDSFNYGDSLHLDIPRFTHFPMDFVLSMGFLLANFCPEKFEELKENRSFISAYKNSQERYWRPYIQSLNSLFQPTVKTEEGAHELHPYVII